MRIIFITREGYNLSGARVRCFGFAGELARYGLEAQVFSFAENLGASCGENEFRMGVIKKLEYNISAFKKLKSILAKDDVIFMQRFNYHSPVRRWRLNPLIPLFIFTFFYMFEFQNMTIGCLQRYQLSRGIEELAEKIRLRVKPGEKVTLVADELDISDQDIIVRSRLSPRAFSTISTITCVAKLDTGEKIRKLILDLKPDYLIWPSDSCLQKKIKLNLGKKTIKLFGWRLEPVDSQVVFDRSNGLQKYNIYKMD